MRLLVVLSFLSFASSEQTTPASNAPAFHLLDTNNDGSLSVAELYAYYDRFDTNSDGELTLMEMTRSIGGTQTPSGAAELQAQFTYYDKLDGTQDQRVTRKPAVLAFQAILDLNADGSITLPEFEAGFAKVVAAMRAELVG